MLQREWIKEIKQLCQDQVHVSKLTGCKAPAETTLNLHQVVISLWLEDEREFQYLALDLMLACKDFLNSGDLPLIETLITKKTWWDTVDMLASGILGPMSAKRTSDHSVTPPAMGSLGQSLAQADSHYVSAQIESLYGHRLALRDPPDELRDQRILPEQSHRMDPEEVLKDRS